MNVTPDNRRQDSVKVMLEHYGRIQQSDFDQIAEACMKVREQKEQMTGSGEVFSVPFFSQNKGAIMKDTNVPLKSKASLYTAVEGVMGVDRAESPSCPDLQDMLENKVHESSQWQEWYLV